jgi:hypothetical protein
MSIPPAPTPTCMGDIWQEVLIENPKALRCSSSSGRCKVLHMVFFVLIRSFLVAEIAEIAEIFVSIKFFILAKVFAFTGI